MVGAIAGVVYGISGYCGGYEEGNAYAGVESIGGQRRRARPRIAIFIFSTGVSVLYRVNYYIERGDALMHMIENLCGFSHKPETGAHAE